MPIICLTQTIVGGRSTNLSYAFVCSHRLCQCKKIWSPEKEDRNEYVFAKKFHLISFQRKLIILFFPMRFKNILKLFIKRYLQRYNAILSFSNEPPSFKYFLRLFGWCVLCLTKNVSFELCSVSKFWWIVRTEALGIKGYMPPLNIFFTLYDHNGAKMNLFF